MSGDSDAAVFEVEPEAPFGWHVIHGEDLLALLRRAHAGEDADLLFLEAYASAEHHKADEE